MRVCVLAAALSAGCRLSDAECSELRTKAFEIINRSHACMDDTDCVASEWPGCPKPVDRASKNEIEALRGRFAEGSCREEATACPPSTEVHCNQNLCASRHLP